MAEKTVAMPDTHERATQPEGTWTRERSVTPPVDIYEMPEGLVVIADVPGVTPDHCAVHVDNHILKHGVLTLTLSKVAEAQPRTIAVAVS
jgi:HSP20 family molecular chaperone IbpA